MKTQAKFNQENTMQTTHQKRSMLIIVGVLVAVVCSFMLLYGNGSEPKATTVSHLTEVQILPSVLTLKTITLIIISVALPLSFVGE